MEILLLSYGCDLLGTIIVKQCILERPVIMGGGFKDMAQQVYRDKLSFGSVIPVGGSILTIPKEPEQPFPKILGITLL